ncbi:MAG: Crp/Fnr family transcriptional regulator [Mucilaginibacter sp.]|uniref:Crp/Fnr family transcriptional regulator n=1 Tax=Mucilaginibacter sp. TaxID=1882438 RepID=UPI0032668FBC
MDDELLLHILNLIQPLSARLQARFLSCITEKKLPKKHKLLLGGQTANAIYFIKSGFARAFYHTRSGKECTSWFMGTGDIMISVYSFYSRQPAQETIELLEDSTIQFMSWSDVQGIYADFPEFNYHGRLLTEKYYIASEQRATLLRTGTAAERYALLLKSYPQILLKASLLQIASYLNVSHEALCRIRSGGFAKRAN